MHIGKIRLLSTVAVVFWILIGCTSTENKSQPTAATTQVNGGRVEGTVTSADEVGKPLPNVLIQLSIIPLHMRMLQQKQSLQQ
jgi:hypothetical protein